LVIGLLGDGTRRFSELRRSIDGISHAYDRRSALLSQSLDSQPNDTSLPH
jgi:DNA-binding HxlR family transcriptional regulator